MDFIMLMGTFLTFTSIAGLTISGIVELRKHIRRRRALQKRLADLFRFCTS